MNKMMPLAAVIAVVVIAAVLFVMMPKQQAGAPSAPAPGGGGGLISPPPAPAGGATANVVIKNFAFSPNSTTVQAGTTVTWKNEDSVIHDVTIELSGSKLSDHDVNPGESYSVKFDNAGIYDYHCDIHVAMKGTVIVT